MALSPAEATAIANRFEAIERILNNIQTALNNVPTKVQLNALLNIRQSEIIELRQDLEHLEATGIGPALAAHKIDPSAHGELNNRFFQRDEFIDESTGTNDAGKPILLTNSGLIDLSMIPPELISSDGITDHGLLTGLNDDDHLIYHTDARGDIRYFTKEQHINLASGINNAGAPIVLNNRGLIDDSMLNTSPDTYTIYMDPNGDDTATGESGSPIQSIDELIRRIPLLGGNIVVNMAAGTYRLSNLSSETFYGKRTALGSLRSYLRIVGELNTIETFTVASTSGISITASGSPGWTTNEHRGRLVAITNFGQTFYHPVIANTSDTLTINISSTNIGGAYSLPSNGSSITLFEPGAKIAPPSSGAAFFQSRLFFFGRIHFFGVDFDGTGGGFSGPTALESAAYYFNACWFRNFSGRGLELRGSGFVAGCYFASCNEASLAIDSEGFVQVNDTHVHNTQTGYRASFNSTVHFGSQTIISGTSVTEELINAKTNATINDESYRVYLDSVRDFAFLQRGSTFTKVNTYPLIGISGFANCTRYVFKLDSGNYIELANADNQTLTASTAYFNLNNVQNISFADFQSNNYTLSDVYANVIHDPTRDSYQSMWHIGERRFTVSGEDIMTIGIDGIDLQGKQVLGAGAVQSQHFLASGETRAFRGEAVEGNVAAPTVVFQGSNAAWDSTSEVNTTTFVMSGIPTNRLTIVDYTNISAGFQFQILMRRLNNNGAAETITFTAGTHFTAETSNAQTAINIAEAINAVTTPVDGPLAIASGEQVRLLPSPNTINCSFWVAFNQTAAWTYAQGARTLNIGVGFPGTGAGAGTINIGVNGDVLNFGANIGSTRHTGAVQFGVSSAMDARLFQPTVNTLTFAHVTNVKASLSPAGIAHTISTVTLGAADDTFAVASNVVSITGNGGGNEVTTATLNTPAVPATYTNGLEVTLIFEDSNVTIKTTAYASREANEIHLKGGDYTSVAGGTLTLLRDSVGWVEKCRT